MSRRRYGIRSYVSATVHLPRRLAELEEAVTENRQLNRRLAELTDILTEVLVPATERDEEKLAALLSKFREESLAP